jgi:3-oxoacyl-[acyl-carrier-protein] synthase II
VSDQAKRVFIAGLGVVSPVGRTAAFWDALLKGEGVPLGRDGGYSVSRIVDYRPPANLDAEAAAYLGRCSLFAADAAIQAVEDARLPFTAQTAPLIGVSFGSELGELEKQVAGAPAASVARILGIAGPLLSHVGPASGLLAIAEAAEMVRRGEAPVVVAGGADALPPLDIAGRPRPTLSRGAGRPFDAARDGVVLGEGAAAVVLEDAELAQDRGVRVYGEVLGHGNAFSRATVMKPGPNFVDAARSMRAALLRAEAFQGEVEVLLASASGDPEGDAIEARALKDLWGPNVDRLTILAIQGLIGDAMAASGPLSLVAALSSMNEAIVPPTVGLSEVDPDFRQLDIVTGKARQFRWGTGMVNAFGPGANVSLVIRTAE